MAIGAAGAAGGALSDTGVDDDFMKRLGEELAAGKAALILLIRKVAVDKVLPEIEVPGAVIQTSLSQRGRAGTPTGARRRAQLTRRQIGGVGHRRFVARERPTSITLTG